MKRLVFSTLILLLVFLAHCRCGDASLKLLIDNVMDVVENSPQVLFISDFVNIHQVRVLNDVMSEIGATNIAISENTKLPAPLHEANCDMGQRAPIVNQHKSPFIIIVWVESDDLFEAAIQILTETAAFCSDKVILGAFEPETSILLIRHNQTSITEVFETNYFFQRHKNTAGIVPTPGHLGLFDILTFNFYRKRLGPSVAWSPSLKVQK